MQKYAKRWKRYCVLDMPYDTSSSVTIMTTLKLVTPSKNTQNFNIIYILFVQISRYDTHTTKEVQMEKISTVIIKI